MSRFKGRLKRIEKRLTPYTAIRAMDCACEGGTGECSPSCEESNRYHELYLEHKEQISTGSLSWEAFFCISKDRGFNSEFDTYEEYRAYLQTY